MSCASILFQRNTVVYFNLNNELSNFVQLLFIAFILYYFGDYWPIPTVIYFLGTTFRWSRTSSGFGVPNIVVSVLVRNGGALFHAADCSSERSYF